MHGCLYACLRKVAYVTLCVYVYAWMCVCVEECMRVYADVLCVYMRVYADVCVCKGVCVHACLCVCGCARL